MPIFNLEALKRQPVMRQPFDYLVLPNFVNPEARPAINAAFPHIEKPGSFPISELSYGPAFAGLLDALHSDALRWALEDKFAVSLRNRPTLLTVRGWSGTRDGQIHTDSVSKVLTVLIYLNSNWQGTGGCLRLLRSASDIEDVVTEIPPVDGTLVAFRRSDNSFHGHKLFVGPRRVVQFNWVTGQRFKLIETGRHRLTAWFKKLNLW